MDTENPISEQSSKEREKELAHAWKGRYIDALDEVVEREGASLHDLVDVLWEKGILDRVAPLDAEEKAARQSRGSDVWNGSRDDAELYLRIMYSAAYGVEAQRRRLTAAPSPGYVGAAMGMAFGASIKNLDKFFIGEDRKDPITALNKVIIERARGELRRCDSTAKEKIIPWGAEGLFHDIPVIVDSYTLDGGICLAAKNSKDHMHLGEFTRFSVTSPIEFNPDNFKIPEPPDKVESEFVVPSGRMAGRAISEIRYFLTTNHIVADYDDSWTDGFWVAVDSYKGKQIKLKVKYDKDHGISFEVQEI